MKSELVKSAYVSYVYLIGYQDKIKIGKANNPRVRLSTLQVGIPEKINIIGSIGCSSEKEAYEIEELLHNEYADKNIRAEWYSLTPDECNKILCKYVDRMDVEIPSKVLGRMLKDLNAAEFKVMLYHYSRPPGCVFDYDEIAEYADLSIRTVKASCKSLIVKEYLYEY